MAILDQEENRESWLAWAIELMRRGISPTGDITVHGPHAPPADCMWGEAEGTDISGEQVEVRFRTPRGLTPRDKWKVRNLRVMTDSWEGEVNLPILPARELPKGWRDKLSALRQELEQEQEQWRQARQKFLQRR